MFYSKISKSERSKSPPSLDTQTTLGAEMFFQLFL